MHLMEELRDDARRENAGKEIVAAWEKNVEKLKGARDHFDVVIGLYDPNAEAKHKELMEGYAKDAAVAEAAKEAAKAALQAGDDGVADLE
jgi:hypothetical protein